MPNVQIFVDVKLVAGGDPLNPAAYEFAYKIQPCMFDNGNGNVNVAAGGGPAMLAFHLGPNSAEGVEFDSDPFWIESGQNCPPAQGVEAPFQIRAATPDYLQVWDGNPYGDNNTYTYCLNFKRNVNGAVVTGIQADPEVKNGGHGFIGGDDDESAGESFEWPSPTTVKIKKIVIKGPVKIYLD